MAAAASNVVDLASYRAARWPQKSMASLDSSMQYVQVAWIPVWFVPLMPLETGPANGN